MTERATIVSLGYDRSEGQIIFALDAGPAFRVSVGDLNKLLSLTCVHVQGYRFVKDDKEKPDGP